MRLLLDTHAFVWWTLDNPRLSGDAHKGISEADEVFVSVATAWEIAIKVGKGRWPDAEATLRDFEIVLANAQLHLLGITIAHVRAAGLMTSPHRDPFDRLLAAQASIEGLTLVTADPMLTGLGAQVMW